MKGLHLRKQNYPHRIQKLENITIINGWTV